jgi:hypothetical protein
MLKNDILTNAIAQINIFCLTNNIFKTGVKHLKRLEKKSVVILARGGYWSIENRAANHFTPIFL